MPSPATHTHTHGKVRCVCAGCTRRCVSILFTIFLGVSRNAAAKRAIIHENTVIFLFIVESSVYPKNANALRVRSWVFFRFFVLFAACFWGAQSRERELFMQQGKWSSDGTRALIYCVSCNCFRKRSVFLSSKRIVVGAHTHTLGGCSQGSVVPFSAKTNIEMNCLEWKKYRARVWARDSSERISRRGIIAYKHVRFIFLFVRCILVAVAAAQEDTQIE